MENVSWILTFQMKDLSDEAKALLAEHDLINAKIGINEAKGQSFAHFGYF